MLKRNMLVAHLVVTAFVFGVSCAAQEPPNLETVAAKLEKSEVLGVHHSFSVQRKGQGLVVTTAVIPNATDDDYKINAVLVAKKVAEIWGKPIPKVKVVFVYADGSGCRLAAVVRDGDIKAFGSGLESKEQLLASIDLEREQPGANSAWILRNPTPVPEPPVEADANSIQEALQITDSYIKELAGRGVGVRPFQDKWNLAFKMLEEGKLKGAALEIDSLKKALREEERVIEEQRHPRPVLRRGGRKVPPYIKKRFPPMERQFQK